MEEYPDPLTRINIQVFGPDDAGKEVKLTPARAMLLYSLFYYETLGENSSLFVANKLAYFLSLGEKSFNRLTFEASHYGPYSVGVEHMLHNLNGKYLKGLEQMNAKAFEPLEMQYDRIEEIRAYINHELKAEQKATLKNLVELVDGFQSALSLEVLATVDFVKETHKVSARKISLPLFTAGQIGKRIYFRKNTST